MSSIGRCRDDSGTWCYARIRLPKNRVMRAWRGGGTRTLYLGAPRVGCVCVAGRASVACQGLAADCLVSLPGVMGQATVSKAASSGALARFR